MYTITFSRQAAGYIKGLEKGHREKLKARILGMRENPFSHPYRKIRGERNLYRIRVGDSRLLFEVNERDREVVFLKADKRSKVYR